MSQSRTSYFLGIVIVILFLLGVYTYGVTSSTPRNFPVGGNFVVEENETLKSVSTRLESEHYINSALLFRALISSRGRDRHIKAGGYTFNEALVLDDVVEKFATGHPDAPLVSVTIPEGSTVKEIAMLVHKVLPSISENSFVEVVERAGLSGKLFPSTYFLLPSSTAEGIITTMKNTFENKYIYFVKGLVIPEPLTNEIEVLSLAAILEGEAKTKEDMQMVAGILLARLQKGMPLQVDAAPETYKNKGLPAVPINNPGEVAISAVFNATSSPYLYYITGKDGNMYYAKTFEEHKRNIVKYLR